MFGLKEKNKCLDLSENFNNIFFVFEIKKCWPQIIVADT